MADYTKLDEKTKKSTQPNKRTLISLILCCTLLLIFTAAKNHSSFCNWFLVKIGDVNDIKSFAYDPNGRCFRVPQENIYHGIDHNQNYKNQFLRHPLFVEYPSKNFTSFNQLENQVALDCVNKCQDKFSSLGRTRLKLFGIDIMIRNETRDYYIFSTDEFETIEFQSFYIADCYCGHKKLHFDYANNFLSAESEPSSLEVCEKAIVLRNDDLIDFTKNGSERYVSLYKF